MERSCYTCMDKVKLNELVFGGFKYPQRKIQPSSSSSTDITIMKYNTIYQTAKQDQQEFIKSISLAFARSLV